MDEFERNRILDPVRLADLKSQQLELWAEEAMET